MLMSGEASSIVTPIFWVVSGSCESAVCTRLRTPTAPISTGYPMSNVTVILLEPFELELLDM